jgi:flagellar biogenesis protein FliO
VKRETELQPGAGNFITTELLRVSSSPLGRRFIAMWERVLRISRRTPKRLRLCESLPLGERRFVAVVEFEQNRFLLGGTPSSLVLLSRLEDAGDKKEDDSEEQPRGETC